MLAGIQLRNDNETESNNYQWPRLDFSNNDETLRMTWNGPGIMNPLPKSNALILHFEFIKSVNKLDNPHYYDCQYGPWEYFKEWLNKLDPNAEHHTTLSSIYEKIEEINNQP